MDLPPWLNRVYQRIERTDEQGQLSHAILLDAIPGWGVTDLAERVCELIIDEPVDFLLDRNLDLLQIRVEEGKKSISIDQVRAGIEFLQNTAVNSLRKVLVIHLVERLSIVGSQALLKILEEPPKDKHIVLISCQSALLMPTIRSRCQRYLVLPGTDEERADFLKAEQLAEADVQKYLNEYGGSPHSILDAVKENRVCIRDTLRDLTRKKVSPVEASTQLLKVGDVDQLLRAWLYITHRFAQNVAAVSVIAEFYDTLIDIRRQFLEVPGLDASSQVQRLCIKWQNLNYRQT